MVVYLTQLRRRGCEYAHIEHAQNSYYTLR